MYVATKEVEEARHKIFQIQVEATKKISWCYGQMDTMVTQTQEALDQLTDELEEAYPSIRNKKLDKPDPTVYGP